MKTSVEQAERRQFVRHLRNETPMNWTRLEPMLSEIEERFITGELTSKDAADEIYKLTLMIYPSDGTA